MRRSSDFNPMMRASVSATSTRWASAQMLAAVAAAVQTDAPAGRAGEGSHHIGADRLIAGMVERGLGALGVGAGLFPNRLEPDGPVLEVRIFNGRSPRLSWCMTGNCLTRTTFSRLKSSSM